MFPGKMPRMSTVYTFIVPFVCCALCDCRNGGVSTTAFKKKKLRHTSLRLQHIDARITTQLLYFIAGLMLLALSFGTSNNRTRLLQPPARSTNIYASLLSSLTFPVFIFHTFRLTSVVLSSSCPSPTLTRSSCTANPLYSVWVQDANVKLDGDPVNALVKNQLVEVRESNLPSCSHNFFPSILSFFC